MPLTRGGGRLFLSQRDSTGVNAALARLGSVEARYQGAVCMPIGEFRTFMKTRQSELLTREIEPGASLPFSVPPEVVGPAEHARISAATRAAMAEAMAELRERTGDGQR